MSFHDVFHVSMLAPWHDDPFPSRLPDEPGPVEFVDGLPAYEAERILDSRRLYGRLQHWVHWKGWDPIDDEWAEADEFEDDDSLVLDFHALHPDRPSTPRRSELALAHRRLSGANLEEGDTVTGLRPVPPPLLSRPITRSRSAL